MNNKTIRYIYLNAKVSQQLYNANLFLSVQKSLSGDITIDKPSSVHCIQYGNQNAAAYGC